METKTVQAAIAALAETLFGLFAQQTYDSHIILNALGIVFIMQTSLHSDQIIMKKVK